MDYYDYGSTASGLTSGETAALGALGGALIIFFLVMMAICLTIAILTIIGQWKVLKKGGQPGWAALIPFYNQYCLCKVSGVNPWWVLIAAVGPLVLALIPVLGELAGAVISIYFVIILNVSLARSFNKSDGYAAGLILLAPIFFLLLGREKEVYAGPKPMHDIVFDDWFKQNKNTNNANNANSTVTNTEVNNNVQEAQVSEDNQSRFCPNCGAKIEGDSKFCASCGKEV